jgi:hypothetical protein
MPSIARAVVVDRPAVVVVFPLVAGRPAVAGWPPLRRRPWARPFVADPAARGFAAICG